MGITVGASILAGDFGRLAEEIVSTEKTGVTHLHIDVMDGTFVPPITFGCNMVELAKKVSSLFLDVHLMIVNPINHIENFCKAGSDRITFHIEAVDSFEDAREVVRGIKSYDIQAGIAIKPKTDLTEIKGLLDYIDMVLIMSVEPGWAGQQFIKGSEERIRRVKSWIDGSESTSIVGVDGGVNKDTVGRCVEAGAEYLVVGSYFYRAADRRSALKALQENY